MVGCLAHENETYDFVQGKEIRNCLWATIIFTSRTHFHDVGEEYVGSVRQLPTHILLAWNIADFLS